TNKPADDQIGGLNTSKNLRLTSALLRGQNHDHLAALELGHVLDPRHVGQFVANTLKQSHADVLVGDLAAAIAQRDLALVTVFSDEAAQIAHLDQVVALVRTRTELDFL